MQVNLKHTFVFFFLNQGLLTSEMATAGDLCLLAANTYKIALGIGDNQLGQACLSLVFSLVFCCAVLKEYCLMGIMGYLHLFHAPRAVLIDSFLSS